MQIKDLENKIINADCMDILKHLPDKCIDLVLTDIPFGECNRKSNGIRDFDYGVADIVNFDLKELLKQIIRICKGSFYMFCGTEQVSDIRQTLVDNNFAVFKYNHRNESGEEIFDRILERTLNV